MTGLRNQKHVFNDSSNSGLTCFRKIKHCTIIVYCDQRDVGYVLLEGETWILICLGNENSRGLVKQYNQELCISSCQHVSPKGFNRNH